MFLYICFYMFLVIRLYTYVVLNASPETSSVTPLDIRLSKPPKGNSLSIISFIIII